MMTRTLKTLAMFLLAFAVACGSEDHETNTSAPTTGGEVEDGNGEDGGNDPPDSGDPDTGQPREGRLDLDDDGIPCEEVCTLGVDAKCVEDIEVEDDSEYDCDDTDPDIAPGNIEICDGKDNDCNGETDDDATDAITWYIDSDADGYGDAGDSQRSCTAPSNSYVDLAGDCDDRDSDVNPDATEVCDGKDNDCNGIRDTESIEWNDADNDGTCDGADEDAWNHNCDGLGTIGTGWDNVPGWTGEGSCYFRDSEAGESILTSREELVLVEYEVQIIAISTYGSNGEGSMGFVIGYDPSDETQPYLRVRFLNYEDVTEWSGLVIEEWDGTSWSELGSAEMDHIAAFRPQFQMTVTEDITTGDATLELSLQDGGSWTWDDRADELENIEITRSSGFVADGQLGFYTEGYTLAVFDTPKVIGLRE